MNGTETHDNFNFDEFYNIVTKKRSWLVYLIIISQIFIELKSE
jgi:hypothetical protein